MSPRKLLRRILENPANVRFGDFVVLATAFGFELARVSGTHHIFKHRDIPELINIQDCQGEAKPYQIRQFLEQIQKSPGGCHWQLAASAACDTGGQAARGTRDLLSPL